LLPNTSGIPAGPLAPQLAPGPENLPASPHADPDLARVVKAWTILPAPIRRAILSLVDSGR
jgi:hypothetical protein